ncbi:DUF669 domain-containing protein [Aerococcaceae bacterium zg-ZJ1578]|uniref:DUF669 domain-containing protein n=1 Tax=Aerococcaceae bacterium zg-252 TaxID=2796928 RepID=UPI001A2132FF|nr:DUF669 domain-containing protein [Aerococcaceae bacterium zg-1578]MBR7928403.1 DUF669 domain-containing protein [Aerococcaceae bacterium zg-ZUI334]
MTFQYDFNDKYEAGLKDGEYEVVIRNAVESVTKGGAEYIDMPLVVRNDVQQPGQNGLIFHKIWKAKATGVYDKRALNTIGFAADMNQSKQYSSLAEVLQDLQGRPCKVRVRNEESEYNGKTYTNLNVKGWKQTEFPNVQHQWKNDNAPTNNSPFAGAQVNLTEDDLPF